MGYSCVDRLHAYIDESGREYSLVKHLLNTYIVVKETSLHKRYSVVAKKVSGETLEKKEFEKLFYTIPLLHDIGKSMIVYQERPRGYDKKYYLHEIISGIIVDEILFYKYSRFPITVKSIGMNTVKWCLFIYSLVLHHYAMNRLRGILKIGSRFREIYRGWREWFKVRVMDIECILESLANILRNYGEYELVDLLGVFLENTRKYSREYLDITLHRVEVFINKFMEKTVDCMKVGAYVSTLTGLTSIADYVAGALERGGSLSRGYVKYILRESEIENLKKKLII